jgi:hypothetical protein
MLQLSPAQAATADKFPYTKIDLNSDQLIPGLPDALRLTDPPIVLLSRPFPVHRPIDAERKEGVGDGFTHSYERLLPLLLLGFSYRGGEWAGRPICGAP